MVLDKLPGCYGLPSTHNLTTATCQACGVKASCRTAALELAKQVNETVDIQPIVDRLKTDSDAPIKIKRTRKPKETPNDK